jgi:hypothetical protein
VGDGSLHQDCAAETGPGEDWIEVAAVEKLWENGGWRLSEGGKTKEAGPEVKSPEV